MACGGISSCTRVVLRSPSLVSRANSARRWRCPCILDRLAGIAAVLMIMVMPMPVHAVAAMAPPREGEQQHDHENRKERKKEMMRIRMKSIRRIGTDGSGIEPRREQPGGPRNDQREQRHPGHQMKEAMAAPAAPSLSAFVVISRRDGRSGFIDGKLLADTDADFGHGRVLELHLAHYIIMESSNVTHICTSQTSP